MPYPLPAIRPQSRPMGSVAVSYYPTLSDPTKQKLWFDYLLSCTDTLGATLATAGQAVWTVQIPTGWSSGGDNLLRQNTSGQRPTWQTDGLQTDGSTSNLLLPAAINLTGDFTIYYVGYRTNAATQALVWTGNTSNTDAPLSYTDGNTYLLAGGANWVSATTGLIIRRIRRSGVGANNTTLTDAGASSAISTAGNTLDIEKILQRGAADLCTTSSARTLAVVVVSAHLTPGGADDLAIIAALQARYAGLTGP